MVHNIFITHSLKRIILKQNAWKVEKKYHCYKPKTIFVFLNIFSCFVILIMRKDTSTRIFAISHPFRHPVIWDQLAHFTNEFAFKYFSVIISFLGLRWAVRETCRGVGNLIICYLKRILLQRLTINWLFCKRLLTLLSKWSWSISCHDFLTDETPSLNASFLLHKISSGIKDVFSNEERRRYFSTPF